MFAIFGDITILPSTFVADFPVRLRVPQVFWRNPSGISTYEIVGLKAPLESTVAEKIESGQQPQRRVLERQIQVLNILAHEMKITPLNLYSSEEGGGHPPLK